MSAATASQRTTDHDGFGAACRTIAAAARKSRRFGVFLIHVNGIDRYCAVHGHARGAELLDAFQGRLATLAKSSGGVARMSGRKFAVVLGNLRNTGHMRLAAQKIARLLDDSTTSNAQARLSVTIGAADGDVPGPDAPELLRRAEIAVLDGRRRKVAFRCYQPESSDEILLDWGLESRLAQAIEDGVLEMHFQPKLDLATDTIVGAEALMRWTDPDIGHIAPDVFIDLAETTGQITDLTHFAIQRSCRQASAWRASIGNMNIAINITPSLIGGTEIVDAVRSGSSIWGIEPGDLTLEVTENALMADRDAAHRVLTALRDFGARVSIDDFGTGYSSLAYLKSLPVDELKIDKSFVIPMIESGSDTVIVRSTVDLAHALGLTVVAEGVEDEAHLTILHRIGCDLAQGFHIAEPCDPETFARWMDENGRPELDPTAEQPAAGEAADADGKEVRVLKRA